MKILFFVIAVFLFSNINAQVVVPSADITTSVDKRIESRIDQFKTTLDSVVEVTTTVQGTTASYIDIFQLTNNTVGFFDITFYIINKGSLDVGLAVKSVAIRNLKNVYTIPHNRDVFTNNGVANTKVSITIVIQNGRPQLKITGLSGQTISVTANFSARIISL